MTEPKSDNFHFINYNADWDTRFKTLDEAIKSAKEDYTSGDSHGIYKLVAYVGLSEPSTVPLTMISEPTVVKKTKATNKKKGSK